MCCPLIAFSFTPVKPEVNKEEIISEPYFKYIGLEADILGDVRAALEGLEKDYPGFENAPSYIKNNAEKLPELKMLSAQAGKA